MEEFIMDKIKVIEFFKNDHAKLVNVVNQLDKEQMIKKIVIASWTVKDIIAHISAWNWEIIKQVDNVLVNKKPWYVDMNEANFNKKEVQKRKSWSLDKIMEEWGESFKALIERIEHLTDTEWDFQADFNWPDGSAVTIQSLFEYRYKGEGHEGGHAKQIEKCFEL
jgi:hypothetical protein